ncbi:MAG: aminotransferase class V-fold PLP-dependent enzyme [Thermomicrobiales bacterium]
MATVSALAVDPKVDLVRERMPAARLTGYFNAGTNGPLPNVVVEALIAAAQQEFDTGRTHPAFYGGVKDEWQRLRERIASVFGANADEIALTRSTTEGINIALMGLDWQRGDEVVTTNLEHPGIMVPLALVAHRYGAVIRIANVGNGGGDVAAAIQDQITHRTRAIAISHAMWSTGAVIPLRQIADLAHERRILVVVDAAQAAGQAPVNLHEVGVDAYAISGQKWLCGPGGTGALYVRKERHADIRPTYIRSAMTEPTGYLLPPAGAVRYEIGEFYTPALIGQAAGLAWLQDQIGFDWIYDRVASLGQRCWEGLNELDGVSVITPRDRMAGLVCFTVENWHPRRVMEALYQRGHTIRFVEYAPGPTVARVSCGWWCTEDEVDGLVAAVGEIAATTS